MVKQRKLKPKTRQVLWDVNPLDTNFNDQFEYLDQMIRGLEKMERNDGDTFTLRDGTAQEGYLLKYHRLQQILFVLYRLRDYVHKKPPGPPNHYKTLWDAYFQEPKFRQYLEAEEEYVNANGGREHGKRAFAIRAVAGDNPYKQENLRKQIDKWMKLPRPTTEEIEEIVNLRKEIESRLNLNEEDSSCGE